MTRFRLLVGLSVVIWCAGCGDDDGGDGDTGVGTDGAMMRPDAGVSIAAPAEVSVPALPEPPAWPCPTGWREIVTTGRPARCEPWPESGREVCTGVEAHLPGEPGCAPVGVACPAGDYADGLPASGVLYVDASGSAGGDGSAGDPFGQLSSAVAAASAGDVIALSKGAHDGPATIPAGVTLRGACPDETIISSSAAADDDGVLDVGGAGVVIRDLSIRTSERPGISVSTGSAEVRGVAVLDTTSRGIVTSDGVSITVEDFVARGVQSRARDGSGGQGVLIQSGSSATLTRIAIDQCRGAAIAVFDPGTTVELTDAALTSTRGIPDDGNGGSAIFGAFSTTITGTRVVAEDSRSAGVGAFEDSTLTLEDSVIRMTGPADPGTATGRFGRALVAEGGSTSTLRRGYVEDAFEIGVIASGVDSRVVLEDVSLTGVQEEMSSGEPGRCMTAQSGGFAEMRRVHLSNCYGQGVVVTGFQSGGQFEDTTVTGIEAERGGGTFGYGFSVQSGATVTVTRLLVDGARDIGVSIVDEANVTGSDITVRDVGTRVETDTGGRGVEIGLASSATLDRVLIEESRELGLFVDAVGTAAGLSNVTVRDILGQPDGTRGRGVSLQRGASGTVSGLLVERVRGGGVVVDGAGDATDFTLEDVVIRDVVNDEDNGAGLTVISAGTRATVRRMRVERVPLAGVVVGTDAELAAEDIVIDDVQADAAGEFGRGINVQAGGVATFARLLVDRGREIAVYAGGDGTRLELADFVVRETTSRELDGKYGRGASVESGGALIARRGRVEMSQDIGVAVLLSSTAELEDVEIVGVAERACASTTCTDNRAGHGLAVLTGSTATATGFTFSDAATCGVMLARGGVADLTSGDVRGNTIGVCVQTDGFDLDRLMNDVVYVDNTTNLDTTSLPVPEASPQLDAQTAN